MMLGILAAAIRRAIAPPPPPQEPLDSLWSQVAARLTFDTSVTADEKPNTWSIVGSGVAPSQGVTKFGNAVSFTGAGRLVAAMPGNLLPIDTRDFTFEGWIYLNSGGSGYRDVFICGTPDKGLAIDAGGRLLWYDAGASTTHQLSAQQWYHVAATRRAGWVRVFVNGVKTAEIYKPTKLDVASIGGTTAHAELFNGVMDDIRITVGTARYVENFTPPTSALPTAGWEPPAIGEYWGAQGGWYAGLYGEDHIVIADKASEADEKYKTENTDTIGAYSQTDGRVNMAAINNNNINLHPAAKRCQDHRGGGFADWYLPAPQELVTIRSRLWSGVAGVPAAFAAGGSQVFGAFRQTSAQSSSSTTTLYRMDTDALLTSGSKTNSYSTRAIRRVRQNPPPAIGEYWEAQGGWYVGSYTNPTTGQAWHMVLAPAEAQSAGQQWKTQNTATSLGTAYTGVERTTVMVAAGGHPAASFCRAYTGGGFTDWSLGSSNEMYYMQQNLALLTAPAPRWAPGGEAGLLDEEYWNSNQSSSGDGFAYAGSPFKGFSISVNKVDLRRVRPMRIIPI